VKAIIVDVIALWIWRLLMDAAFFLIRIPNEKTKSVYGKGSGLWLMQMVQPSHGLIFILKFHAENKLCRCQFDSGLFLERNF